MCSVWLHQARIGPVAGIGGKVFIAEGALVAQVDPNTTLAGSQSALKWLIFLSLRMGCH